jgi:hypothetical protein
MHTFLNEINITWYKKTNIVPIVLLIQLSLINISALKAQDTLHHKLGYNPNTTINGGLIGSVIYPGSTIGLERPYSVKYFEKFKKKIHFSRRNYFHSTTACIISQIIIRTIF